MTDETQPSDLIDTPAAGPAAIRGSAVRVTGYGLGALLSLVSVPLLFRHLGNVDYGRYFAAISLVTIVQGITDVGLGQIGVREFTIRGGTERDRLLRNLLGLRFALTSVGVALAVCYGAIVGYSAKLLLGTLLAGAGMVLAVVQGTFAVPLAARLQLGWITALDLLRQVLSVAGIVALVLVGGSVLPFLAVSVPVGLIVLLATVALVRGAMPLRPSFERAQWSSLLRVVLPFAAAVAVATIYLRVTVVLVQLLDSARETGYFSTSFVVISVLIAIPPLTVGSALPVLSRAARDDRERLAYVIAKLVDVTLIFGVGIGLGLVLGAGFVIELLTGVRRSPAVPVLQIQSIAVVTQFVGASWQYGLLSLHRHRALLMISTVGLLLSLSLTFTLVPAFHAQGGAAAFAGGEVAVALGSLFFLRAARPDIAFPMHVPARVLLAAVLALGVALLPSTSSLVRAVIGLGIYAALLVALRAIPPELAHAIRRRGQVEAL